MQDLLILTFFILYTLYPVYLLISWSLLPGLSGLASSGQVYFSFSKFLLAYSPSEMQ